jgi:hypothetical protein
MDEAPSVMPRRFAPPWTTERIPGGYVVKDATGQALAYVYARETKAPDIEGSRHVPSASLVRPARSPILLIALCQP